MTETPVRLAATVLLLREDAHRQMEVFMVVRHQQIDFASGALVFPGGKLAAGDIDPRVRARCLGADELDDDALALRVAGIRETFEESGVLLARARGQDQWLGPEPLQALGQRYRQALDRGEVGIGQMLETEDLVLACDALVPFAHWVTPSFMPKRFDTHFFVVAVPPRQIALHDGQETVDSVWIRPQDAIAAAADGSRTLVPATLLNVQKLGQDTNVDAALAAARRQAPVRVEPRLVERADGRWLEIPEDAGYDTTAFRVPGG
jgi:8-oxo-dGTP pyrophosphatase MutT (NUDIX family)